MSRAVYLTNARVRDLGLNNSYCVVNYQQHARLLEKGSVLLSLFLIVH